MINIVYAVVNISKYINNSLNLQSLDEMCIVLNADRSHTTAWMTKTGMKDFDLVSNKSHWSNIEAGDFTGV